MPRPLLRLLLLPLLLAAFWLALEFAQQFFRLNVIERFLIAFGAVLLWAYINGGWIFTRFHDLRAGLRVRLLPPSAPFSSNDRLLVVAPHPDDEALAAGGQIQTALQAGAQVFTVFLTCGDGFEWNSMVLERDPNPGADEMLDLGRRRIGEALEAAAVLGVPAKNLFFLGYPDGGLMALFLNHYIHPYRSRYTGMSVVPYPQALREGAAYTGSDLERDLAHVLDRVAPTVVLAPSPKDAHRDHRAAAYLTMRELGKRRQHQQLRYYIVHGAYEYPLPKGYFPALPLYPPPRGRGLAWRRVDLSPEQVAVKAEAIRRHRSQVMMMRRFLLAFARRNELWSETPIRIRDALYPEEEGDLTALALDEG